MKRADIQTEQDQLLSSDLNSKLLKGLLLRIALPGIFTVALILLLIFGFSIPLLEKSLLDGRKEQARELTATVLTLLQSYADLVPEQLTLAEAQDTAIYHVRSLRYGPENKDYFWINDMHPAMIVHPFRTELDGTDLTNFIDQNGKNLFVEMVNVVKKEGSGYVEYRWWWKDSERVEEKISFVDGFAPWNWVVGTGLYLEDVQTEIALLKDRAVLASSILVGLVVLLVAFMTRQRYQAEINKKTALITLEQSEQKFRGIFNNSGHFAGILDTDETLLEVNSAALAIVQQKREEVIGQAFRETLWWHGSAKSQDILATILEQCRAGHISSNEVEHRLPNGSVLRVIFTAIPIFGEKGEVARILVEGWDVTEQRLVEEQLRQAQKMEALGQLAGGVAHDFNNLLSGILGYATLLQQSDDLSAGDRDCVEQIVVASNRSADLTRQLSSFSRKDEVQATVVNLHGLIDEVVTLLGRSIDQRIIISQRLNAENPRVVGDASMLQNALLNLGVNARDAMTRDTDGVESEDELVFSSTEVYIDEQSATHRGDQLGVGWYVLISVSDTGCGMIPIVAERIFEPFFTTKDEGKGTGLGLANVYGCAQTHKGAVSVESQSGVGSVFTLLLPRATDDTQVESVPEMPVSVGKGKILFVDDDEVLRKTMSRVLARLGYDSVMCKDGLEAVEYFTNNYTSIDMVILDLIMSHMGGEETFQLMREIDPNARIVISSGFTHNRAVDDLIKRGACGFLGKPFQISELSEVIKNFLPA